jgi:hypothetical protein
MSSADGSSWKSHGGMCRAYGHPRTTPSWNWSPGTPIESIRRLYEEIIDEDRDILSAVTDLDSLSTTGLNRRWVLLHLIEEETARHAGHADLIRESIDGSKGPPLCP